MTVPTDLIAQPDVVALDLPAATGEEAIRMLHARLGAAGGAVSDAPLLLADLLERTRVSSVCIAADIALPHARTAAVERLVLAVGRTAGEAAFDAEHPHVRLVFLIGTPKQSPADYLKLVAGLSRLLRDPVARGALLTAETETRFRAVLARGAGAPA